ncbi:MAG: ribosomal protein [Bacteriovoracaceae bacterium]|nr:ribosomal protein [Bacteriovoracaceae bacterium]
MRHAKPYRKLSRQRSHYTALMRNLAFSIFQHERIRTTLAKAKEVRPFIDQIITLGKGGTLHDRRRAFALLGNITGVDTGGKKLDIVGKVFNDLSKKLTSKGGYTRIIKLAPRPGDAAPMALLELVHAKLKPVKEKKPKDTAEPKQAAAS